MSDTVAHRAAVKRAEVACRLAACWALGGRPRGTPGSFPPLCVGPDHTLCSRVCSDHRPCPVCACSGLSAKGTFQSELSAAQIFLFKQSYHECLSVHSGKVSSVLATASL